MNISLFDYDFNEELIAQKPPQERGGSRLLVYDVVNDAVVDSSFEALIEHLPSNCFLVINNSKVLPARLFGKKSTGGKVEIFYLHEDKDTICGISTSGDAVGGEVAGGDVNVGSGSNSGRCVDDSESAGLEFIGLVRGRLKQGDVVSIPRDRGLEGVANATTPTITMVEQLSGGNWKMRSSVPVLELLLAYGHMPLPPYIDRAAVDSDTQRYQTVYAQDAGSVAAPTAGLHFTDSMLSLLKDKGIDVLEVTLHVGLGTFRPIKSANIDEHVMHSEHYFIEDSVAQRINENIVSGKRLLAVGTTSVRTLESASYLDVDGTYKVRAGRGDTSLFIKPSYSFKVVKDMLTNFHLPKSSLLVLLSAFMGQYAPSKGDESGDCSHLECAEAATVSLAGIDRMKSCYKHAVDSGYRFFSYGDAMLVKGE